MKKMLFLLLAAWFFTGTGCSAGLQPPETPHCRVVTEITVLANNDPESHQRRYSDPKSMIKILNYIRHLDPWDPVNTDDSNGAASFTITVYLSDGTQKSYEQIGLTCFRIPGDIWRQIPAEDGIRLPLIIEAIK